jgi:hypothetical protein
MIRIVLRYGLAVGALVAAFLVATVTLVDYEHFATEGGQIYGYAAMVLAFVLVYFGIRAWRDREGGGAIGFGRAVGVGLLIVLVASFVYVVTWQILYFNVVPDFADRYAESIVERMRAEGAPPAEIAEQRERMAHFAELYDNPLFNAAITFLEIFPVGLVVTLISAAILRRRPGAGRAEAAAGA